MNACKETPPPCRRSRARLGGVQGGDPAETADATDKAQAGHAARLCQNGKPSQAVSQSNPTTLRSARLNSTPIRWTERPRRRYLSA